MSPTSVGYHTRDVKRKLSGEGFLGPGRCILCRGVVLRFVRGV